MITIQKPKPKPTHFIQATHDSLTRLVNLTYLLKSEPKNTQELIESGLFVSVPDFKHALNTALKAGLICSQTEFVRFDPYARGRKHRGRRWWQLTPSGRTFLSFFDNDRRKWREWRREAKQ